MAKLYFRYGAMNSNKTQHPRNLLWSKNRFPDQVTDEALCPHCYYDKLTAYNKRNV